jgi:hypothetical protein
MAWESVLFQLIVLYLQYKSTNHVQTDERDFEDTDVPLEVDHDVINEAALIDSGKVDPNSNPIIVSHLRKLYYSSGVVHAHRV